MFEKLFTAPKRRGISLFTVFASCTKEQIGTHIYASNKVEY